MAVFINGKAGDQPPAPDSEDTPVGEGKVIGKRAFNFNLADQTGSTVRLTDFTSKAPLLIAFYPVDFGLVCTKQLCNYRDSFDSFTNLGIQVVGISPNSVSEHAKFVKRYDFPFPLLSDFGNRVAREYECTSLWMLGKTSRAVFIVNEQGLVLYRYVEPTILTHKNAKKLIMVLEDLRLHKLI